MKIINKLALLILIILKETPQIVKLYKELYINVIKRDEEIKKIAENLKESDKHINTNYVTGNNYGNKTKEEIEKIKIRQRIQRNKIERRYNNEFKHRKVL